MEKSNCRCAVPCPVPATRFAAAGESEDCTSSIWNSDKDKQSFNVQEVAWVEWEQVLLSHVSFQPFKVFHNGFYHQELFGDLEIEVTNSKTQVIWCM